LDPVAVVGGTAYTYLVQAFDMPPDVSTTDPTMTHQTPYDPITAYPLGAGAALDRNSIRPYGASNEQIVHIRFVVQNAGNVNIKVYTLNGTFVRELVNQAFNAGVYGLKGSALELIWDGRNMNGTLVASGVYLITTEMNGKQEIDKVAVIK
jgi:hypothetical protein